MSSNAEPQELGRSRPRVVCWNNQPAPYFVRQMNALADRGRIDVQVWFNERREADRSWSVDEATWRFSNRYLRRRRPARVGEAIALIRRERPDILVTLYGDPWFGSAVVAARLMRVAVILKALRTFPAWRSRSRVREAAKNLLFRMAAGMYVAGSDSARYVLGYGAHPESIYAIRPEIDLAFWEAASSIPPERRDAFRSRHGLGGCVFLYVGRLWRGKGLDVLLDAFGRLAGDGLECSLAIVGDGIDESSYRAAAERMSNVRFAGFREGVELAEWYAAADAFVFPTLGDPYGQVVLEAMACGLPVISSTSAGDIEDRVVHGSTGFLVPPSDSEALRRRMAQLAIDPALRRDMGEAARELVADWSTEHWSERFEEMVFDVVRRTQR